MTKNTTAGVIVEWDTGIATGFASKQEAERFIKHGRFLIKEHRNK